MSPKRNLKVNHGFVPGTLRATGAGTSLGCVLVAPFPDWVALDLASGAFLRASLETVAEPVHAGSEMEAARPLETVMLTLGEDSTAWDPSRPEAVTLSRATRGASASRRAVRKLMRRIAVSATGDGLLGGVGPSVAYADLEGSRRSVVLVAPTGGRVRLDGPAARTLHFRLGDHEHLLPLSPRAAEWLGHTGLLGAVHRRSRSSPVMLTVGFGPPEAGQVRKMVLGVVRP